MSPQSCWFNLLDMGDHKYGDSILVNHPSFLALIDGGYAALASDHSDGRGLPSQISDILRVDPPFDLDLLVVTHCHGDHIGCLPQLVEEGTLKTKWALLADPDLGFPKPPDIDAQPLPRDVVETILAATREEPHQDLSDDELALFLLDAISLEGKYRRMIDSLRAAGTQIVLYGRDALTDFNQGWGPLGVSVLGPTRSHLLRCRDFLRTLQTDALIRAADTTQDAFGLATLPPEDILGQTYRRVANALESSADSPFAADLAGPGSALNDQSIVLLFEIEGAKALLTADMQLAAAEVPGLQDSMARLLERLQGKAPFELLKMPHHSSYNGFNQNVFDRLPAHVYAHSGGTASASHPHRDVLSLLHDQANDREWVRTDRNGRIGIRVGAGPVRLFLNAGYKNDFRPPLAADLPEAPEGKPSAAVGIPAKTAISRPATKAQTSAADLIEITARIPHVSTRVTLTIEVSPGAAAEVQVKQGESKTEEPAPTDSELAGGREIPRLLFVTSSRLGAAVGSDRAERVLKMVRGAGHEVLDTVPWQAEAAPEAAAQVQRCLAGLEGERLVNGVVLLGNYDIVPAVAMDVLDPELRKVVSIPDHDRFVVWSDDPYGDFDGDGVPELAVSRVLHEPGSDELLLRTLSSPTPLGADSRFGIRNSKRPFADDIFLLAMPGQGNMLVSAPITHDRLQARSDSTSVDYFMLHGSAQDATTFWGESDLEDDTVEAFRIGNVPDRFNGVVFAGCCWGALPVTLPAGWRAPGQPVAPRTRNNSIAIRYLAAGAWAFVGCTGTHYSPSEEPFSYFGAPFHQVFWSFIKEGHPPALALLETKKLYAASIPHISGSPDYTAVELKILQQFTCLGLGW